MTEFLSSPFYVRGNELYSIENEKQVRLKGAPDASYHCGMKLTWNGRSRCGKCSGENR